MLSNYNAAAATARHAHPPADSIVVRHRRTHQEDGGFEATSLWFAVQVVVRMAVERRSAMLDPGVAEGINWLKRHDAMQGCVAQFLSRLDEKGTI
jgi:hypothetical protein